MVWNFFLLAFLLFGKASADDDLIGVAVIYRHGDRTPIEPYPTDPYRNVSYWPVDFGQLTNAGKKRHYELGQWLRNRYDGFLPTNYSERDIYVRSTDIDRTLMSAEANLAGLYPPTPNQEWNENLKWQPIPIHTKPQTEDALLASKKPCPKYDMLWQQLFKTEYFRNVTHQNHDLYAYLTRHSGETVTSLETVEYIYNTLVVETANNYVLPDWTLPVFPEKMEPLAFLSFATYAFTPQMARLKTGPLLNHIVNFFENRTAGVGGGPKFLVFSAHDTTIANVLNSLGAFEYHAPPYASCIMMELRKRGDESSYVNLIYKNSSVPREINLRNCDFNCDLVDFAAILKPITISLEDWELECQNRDELYATFKWNVIFACCMLTVILILFLLILKQRNDHFSNYIQIPNEYA